MPNVHRGHTVVVTGLPKSTCTKTDLYRLFTRVAQVKKVFLLSTKGIGYVTLFSSSSVEFVLMQNWTINGCHLKLFKKSETTLPHSYGSKNAISNPFNACKRKQFQIDNVTSPGHQTSTYTDYKHGRNAFWEDVPHHLSNIVPSRKAKAKKTHWEKVTTHLRVVQTCKKRKKLCKIKTKKKRKISREGQRSVKKGTTQHHGNVNNHILLHSEEIHDMPFDTCSQTDINSSFVDKPQTKNNLHSEEKTTLSIPIYVHFKIRPYLVKVKPENPIKSIKEEIEKIEKIPKHLQLILFRGRMLRSDSEMFPYSSVQLLVKGKGGMKEGDSNEDGRTISNVSSEDDVKKWLKKVVKVTPDTLKQCDDLNGDLLFDYHLDQYMQLAADVAIPVGQAYRILSFRDDSSLINSLPLIRHWSVTDVIEFVKSIVKGKDDTEKICEVLSMHQIDGLLFGSYQSVADFQKAFAECDLKGLVLKKLFKKRDDVLAKTQSSGSSVVDECSLQQNFAEHTSIATEIAKRTIQFNSDINFDKYCHYIKKTLNLSHCEGQDNCITCRLLLMCKSDKAPVNMLEKTFGFFILCKLDDFKTPDAVQDFWQRIRKQPMMWISHILDEKERDQFSPSHTEEKVKLRKAEISFSKSFTFRFIMDIEMQSLKHKFDKAVVLVNRRILKKNAIGYKCQLHSSSDKQSYFFNFEKTGSYWIFDPDDYAVGFKKQQINNDRCGKLEKCDVSIPISQESNEAMEKIDKNIQNIDSLDNFPIGDCKIVPPYENKKSLLENNSNLENIHATKEITEKIDEKITAPLLPQKELQFDKTNSDSQWIDINSTRNEILQQSREFREKSDYVVYHEGRRFGKPQNDGILSDRCIEYALFIDKFDKDPMEYFLCETIKFACGCLNSRVNGTLYFGVSNRTQSFEGFTYKLGEIVGFPLSGMDDYHKKFTDELRTAIQKCFSEDVCTIAKHCIGDPVFVEVKTKQASASSSSVMEVDIEPASQHCKNNHFYVNMKPISNIHSRSSSFYIRDGSTNRLLKDKKEIQLFIRTDLPDIVEKRRIIENETLAKKEHECGSIGRPIEKLKRLLLRGRETFDKSVWPILVLGKPSQKQKEPDNDFILNLKFIKKIHFLAVFDFDDHSMVNGLCKFNRNQETSLLQTERVFEEFSGQHATLQDKLKFPEKTVWIFSNGRSDLPEPRPNLKRDEWNDNYSSGVSDAVAFFSKAIQKHRSLVVVLLFSTQFDGLYDTLTDIERRFKWEKIVFITEDSKVFKEFERLHIKYHPNGTDNILKRSIVGVSWKQINAAMNEMTGCDENTNRQIPTSSGALIALDERFEDSLADLKILGSRECESKTFKNLHERREFAHKEEIKFFRGRGVSWWNFYFENHIMKRHKFPEIRERIYQILNNKKGPRIVTLYLVHEPGAGGSTLSRHLMWEFRKNYRCALVTKITENTCRQILSFRKYEDNETPNPVLLVVDEIVQSNVFCDDLERNLYNECRNLPEGTVCCIVVVQREEKLGDGYSDNYFQEMTYRRQEEYLKQKLEKKEIEWLEDKHIELEEKQNTKEFDFRVEDLLSFMIMRKGFNKVYIKTTVKRLIQQLDVEASEFKLLKYTSLISHYGPCSRNGAKPYIPVECCDELMGFRESKAKHFNSWWEQRLSYISRIFLIIENKQTASGKMIRISHSSLATAVLDEVIEFEDIALTDLVKEFLSSSLFESTSHGVKELIEISKEMLVRRMKEEYDDDKTTSFSPLIEEIRKTDQKLAEDLLRTSFDQFQDGMIAQSLARLLSKGKKHDEAITWANTAVEVYPKGGYCYCYHTLGSVLKEKFVSRTTDYRNITPDEAVPFLKIIFESLSNFLIAIREVKQGQTLQVLYSYIDTLVTINLICRFIKQSVRFRDFKVNFEKYLTEENYIPEELSVWKQFHHQFKGLRQTGQNILDVLERHISFHATFYGKNTLKKGKMNMHRSYALLHDKYPVMQRDFADTFGVDCDNPPTGSNEKLNSWHRQRVLRLHGYSYWKIFLTVGLTKTPNSEIEYAETVQTFTEVKRNLDAITERDGRDMMSLVCVNIALGLLDERDRISDKEILQLCLKIVDLNLPDAELSHLFISMILWPSAKFKVDYDDNTLQKSLKILSETSKKYYKRQKQKSSVFSKEDCTIIQPSTQFFLTKDVGVKSVCYRKEISFNDHSKPEDNSFWRRNRNKGMLKRLTGHLTYSEGSPVIVIKNEKSPGKTLQIHRVRVSTQNSFSEEPVDFFLGFSTAGPIAHDVRFSRQSDYFQNEQSHDLQTKSSRIHEYKNKPTEELGNLLKKIDRLKHQHSSRELKKRDSQLIKDEDDIKMELQLRQNTSFDEYT